VRTAYKLGVLIMTGIAGMAAIAWVAHDGGAVRSWLLILTTATAVSGWGMLWIIKPHLLEQDKEDRKRKMNINNYIKDYEMLLGVVLVTLLAGMASILWITQGGEVRQWLAIMAIILASAGWVMLGVMKFQDHMDYKEFMRPLTPEEEELYKPNPETLEKIKRTLEAEGFFDEKK